MTRMEEKQGNSDDTAMNGLKVQLCELRLIYIVEYESNEYGYVIKDGPS